MAADDGLPPFEAGLPREAFAERVAAHIAGRFPGVTIEYLDPLGVSVRWPDGRAHRANLDNLWRTYLHQPEQVESLVGSYLRTLVASEDDEPPPRDAVVALVRARAVVVELAHNARSADDIPVWFPFVADLVVLLAFDLPGRVQLLMPHDLARLAASGPELLELGVTQLASRVGPVQRHTYGALSMLGAGGTYDTSLLLISSLWRKLSLEVPGDLIAAAPSRDALIFTGTEVEGGPELLRAAARTQYTRGSHPGSPALIRWGDGTWLEFED